MRLGVDHGDAGDLGDRHWPTRCGRPEAADHEVGELQQVAVGARRTRPPGSRQGGARSRPGSGRRACTPRRPRPGQPRPEPAVAAREAPGASASFVFEQCHDRSFPPVATSRSVGVSSDARLGSDERAAPPAARVACSVTGAAGAGVGLADELDGSSGDQGPLDLFEPLQLHSGADVHRRLRAALRSRPCEAHCFASPLSGDEPVDLDAHEHRFADCAGQLLLERVDRLFVDLGDLGSRLSIRSLASSSCASRSTIRFDRAPMASSNPEPMRPTVASRLAILTPLCSLIRSSIASLRSTIFMSIDVDTLRQDRGRARPTGGPRRHRLVDHAAHVAEPLLERARDVLIAIVHPLSRAPRRCR